MDGWCQAGDWADSGWTARGNQEPEGLEDESHGHHQGSDTTLLHKERTYSSGSTCTCLLYRPFFTTAATWRNRTRGLIKSSRQSSKTRNGSFLGLEIRPATRQKHRIGFQKPKEAKLGTYIDKKCPFTGNVHIRGRILNGIVVRMKMQRSIVIRRDYLHYIPKYKRFEKRHKNMSVHISPCFRDVNLGDSVTVGECRPLSKTIRFNVLKVNKAPGSEKKQFQKF
ncbi:putative 40S ribosomal protein S11-like [Apostichopus japonicus]|uniref:Small ribosomal subunit protein uS17 n=1 Tax=Stichopus japonicus TaxID=307972 RepID=A0A2G8L378_STIJA|nr:putative 40S ribosomal protein S11-like [Apostichopus japonicus]